MKHCDSVSWHASTHDTLHLWASGDGSAVGNNNIRALVLNVHTENHTSDSHLVPICSSTLIQQTQNAGDGIYFDSPIETSESVACGLGFSRDFCICLFRFSSGRRIVDRFEIELFGLIHLISVDVCACVRRAPRGQCARVHAPTNYWPHTRAQKIETKLLILSSTWHWYMCDHRLQRHHKKKQ